MVENVRQQLEQCIASLEQGTLTTDDLRRVIALLDEAPARQELLYIQAQNTHPGSQALGMTLFRDGRMVEPPADAGQWPYHSALDAVNDGWRIISFPNLALLYDPIRPTGLGCEFILEKWS
jgi:hypothetical protein